MKKLTFKGGIHPDDAKARTAGVPTKLLPPTEIMVFPMLQHLGAPAKPMVKKGDYVKMYQPIGEPSAFVSSFIHSSVSGEVIAVEKRLMHRGETVECVIIKNDFKDEVFEGIATPAEGTPLPEIVKNAGIVGMGGAGFPTHIKLTPPEGKKIKTVIVNGAECEPYLTSDHRVMLEEPDEVIRGLEHIVNWFDAEEGIIAIEENKPDAIALLDNKLAGSKKLSVRVLKKKYPQGSEKHLITAVTGQELPSGALPAENGVAIFNIDTCTAIARAVKYGMPLIRRIVTVSGTIVKNPSNFAVRTGTPISTVLEAAGGTTEDIGKLIMGGPMMGTAITTDELPVVKGTGAVLAFGKDDAALPEPKNCIRCGRCIAACPMRLVPSHLTASADTGDFDKCKKLGIMDCVECGACSYVCPSKRYLVQSIRLAKARIRAQK